jgi:hypothetical protein
MFRFALPIVSLMLVLAGCAPSPSGAAASAGDRPLAELTEIPGMSRYRLGQPIHAGNVSIVPVVGMAANPKQDPDYATLAEAQKNGWIEIREQEGENAVDALEVTNSGPKPILLLTGDLLLGGHQDRVVAKDTVVPPGMTVDVPVYCVEQGRWSGPTEKFTYADTTVPLAVRKEAAFGNQNSVWQSVSNYNGAADAPRNETTVQAGLEQKRVQDAVQVRLSKVLAEFERYENVVGAIFLVNGEIQTLELFGSPKLFASSRDGLLRGALAQGALGNSSPALKVDLKKAAGFFAEALNSRRRETARKQAGKNTIVAAERSSGSSVGIEVHHDADLDGKGSVLLHGSYAKQNRD